jgi:putative acetyltransferase
VLIRTAVATDVEGIMTTHLAAISQVCSKVYQPEEISAWVAGGKDPDRYLPRIVGGQFIVAVSAQGVIGFSDFDLDKGEVCGMFVAPSHMRQGIGKALLQVVEERAVQQRVGRLHLRATLNAIAFYQAQSFDLDGMGSFRLRSGVSVPCAHMHKNLASIHDPSLTGC